MTFRYTNSPAYQIVGLSSINATTSSCAQYSEHVSTLYRHRRSKGDGCVSVRVRVSVGLGKYMRVNLSKFGVQPDEEPVSLGRSLVHLVPRTVRHSRCNTVPSEGVCRTRFRRTVYMAGIDSIRHMAVQQPHPITWRHQFE